MKANYHTHTWRCMHAVGKEREYVERAIEGGLQILGFSDHTPYPYPEGYSSRIRMGLDQLEDYVETVLNLKEEYRDDIEIHLGLEAEYYPAYFQKLQEAVRDYPVEYFLLAQHFLGNEIGEIYAGNATADAQVLKRYCSQVIEAMETGFFTYLAHPDLLHFTGAADVYEEQMRRVCRRAKQLEVPLEINFLGIQDTRHYPDERFWKIAGEEGCSTVFGADAHCPAAVWNPEALRIAEEMAKRYDLHLLETVSFCSPV